jgi:hypothetical protein
METEQAVKTHLTALHRYLPTPLANHPKCTSRTTASTKSKPPRLHPSFRPHPPHTPPPCWPAELPETAVDGLFPLGFATPKA